MRYLFLIFYFIYVNISVSQNFEKAGKKDMLTIAAGFNFSSRFDVIPDDSLPPNHNWQISGNLSLSILDLSIPFSYSFSNRTHNFAHPFNKIGVTPNYKWFKLHVGYCSMNFNQWTLSGQTFPGAGIELSPGKWKVRLLHGRSRPAIRYDLPGDNGSIGFKEMLSAFHSGYDKGQIAANIYTVYARSVVSSLPFIPPGSEVRPRSNLVLSGDAKWIIRKKWESKIEYALSHLNSDLRIGKSPLFHFRENFQEMNFHALTASTGFKANRGGIVLQYERTDPGFISLAAPYTQNDVENANLQIRKNLLGNKLNLSLTTGLQRNDLNNTGISGTVRVVGALTMNYIPGKFFSLSANFNNFSAYTRKNPNSDPSIQTLIDTMNIYQVTRNLGFQLTKKKEVASMNRSFNFQAGYVSTGSISSPAEEFPVFTTSGNGINNIINVQASQNWQLIKKKAGLSLHSNYNRIDNKKAANSNAGLGLSLNKTILKARGTLSVSFLASGKFIGNEYRSTTAVNRIGINVRTKGKPSAILSLGMSSISNFNSSDRMTRLNGSFSLSANI